MKKSHKLYFSVRAAIKEDSEDANSYPTYYKVTYQSIEVPLGNIIQKRPGILLWIILAVVILSLVSCILYFFRKYKKTKKRLDFEVREVRNADFGQEMQSTDNVKKYGRFPLQDMETSKQDI